MQASIRNEFLTLTVDSHGAEAVSIKNAAGEEMLWQADKSVWGRHAPILFPWTGKLAGGILTHAGKSYKGGQHGFARDLEHTLLDAGPDCIRLELRADEEIKASRFPYDFVLTSTFRLEGRTVHHTLTHWDQSASNDVLENGDDDGKNQDAAEYMAEEVLKYDDGGNFIVCMFYSWEYGPRRLRMIMDILESESPGTYEFVTLNELDDLYRQSLSQENL